MHCKVLYNDSRDEVADLFTSVFSASEGEREGALIGHLAATLCADIDNEEIIAFGAYDAGALIGVIFFSRLRFRRPIQVYLLAPVAVSTAHQGRGVGQALIRYGMDALKKRAVEVVVTYGDPGYYARVGFQALSEQLIQAPLELSMPHGWLGCSLTEQPIARIDERPTCVPAFNNPAYW